MYSAIPDGAGGWYAGGPFQSVGGIARRGLVHLLSNGRVDPAFVADLNLGGSNSFDVNSMALNGSQLIIAGSFSTVNLVPRTGCVGEATTGQALLAVVDGDGTRSSPCRARRSSWRATA